MLEDAARALGLSWGTSVCHPSPLIPSRELPSAMAGSFGGRKYWVQIPSLLLTSFTVCDQLLKPSERLFP